MENKNYRIIEGHDCSYYVEKEYGLFDEEWLEVFEAVEIDGEMYRGNYVCDVFCKHDSPDDEILREMNRIIYK